MLHGLDTAPDFACHQTAVGDQIRYIHRSVGGDEVYFVASGIGEARRFLCTFRQKGKRPEFWWPDTGRIEPVTIYDEARDGTRIPISMDPYGSVMVVFRGESALDPNRVVSLRHDGVEISGLAPKPVPEMQIQHTAAGVRISPSGQYSIEVAEPGDYALQNGGWTLAQGTGGVNS